ncbi:MAG: flavodoxin family protein [Sphaerochaetaceae bacterium]|nr:flavodoxin family protein [Sphaerochaetaceae bacterium]
MKVLLINGSPRKVGNTYTALTEMIKVFNSQGIETQLVDVGSEVVRGCIQCNACKQIGRCIVNDKVNEVANLLKDADGLVIGTPVYYGSANATTVALLDRLFYSSRCDLTMKVGAGVAVGRRGGLSSTYDEINKYFAFAGMPIASGQYWSGVHGRDLGEAKEDAEGLQQMRTLANNMAFLIKAIKLGKDAYGLPIKEEPIRTSFIRK